MRIKLDELEELSGLCEGHSGEEGCFTWVGLWGQPGI